MIYLGTPVTYWALFIIGIFGLMALDLGIINRKRKLPTIRESLLWTGFYALLATAFGLSLPLFHPAGTEASMAFFTAYVLEKSLSLDNIFVMSLIFAALKIPTQFQHRVLFWGILGVIVLRGIFISLGAVLVSQLFWVLSIFGGFLIYTGIKTFKSEEDEQDDINDSKLLHWLKKHLSIDPSPPHWLDGRFFSKITERCLMLSEEKIITTTRRCVTIFFVALVMVECADIVFAVDSIPAVFAVTQDAFIVFTSNLFAILGLRSLYFVLVNMLERFEHLGKSVSVVLIFIGVKILLEMPTPVHFHIPQIWSMAVVFSLLTAGVGISWIRTKKEGV